MISRSTITINKAINNLAIMTLFGVVVWVGFAIYSAWHVVPQVEVDPKLLVPVNVEMDTKVLDAVVNRKQLEPTVDNQISVIEVAPSVVQPTESSAPSGAGGAQ